MATTGAGAFERFTVETDTVSHDVYVTGSGGPGVLLLHEIAGLTTNTLELASEIAATGLTVAVPHLFGRMEGEGAMAMATGFGGMLGRCIAREMTMFVANQPRRGTEWLLAAAEWLAGRTDSPRGVGVIGMCATGSFAMGAVFDPNVGAVVASQAATPMVRGCSWGVPGGDQRLGDVETPVMALRFRRDGRAAACRVERLAGLFGESPVATRDGPDDPTVPTEQRGIEIVTGDRLHVVWADGEGHSVLNFHRVDRAVDQVIAFLHANLDRV